MFWKIQTLHCVYWVWFGCHIHGLGPLKWVFSIHQCPAWNRRDLYPWPGGRTFQLLKYVDPHLMNEMNALEDSNPTLCLSGLVRISHTRFGTPKMGIFHTWVSHAQQKRLVPWTCRSNFSVAKVCGPTLDEQNECFGRFKPYIVSIGSGSDVIYTFWDP